MTKLNIHDAKTHLSKYLLRVQAGETLTLCKNDVPVALITPLPKKKRPKRQLFGLAKGKIKIHDSFFDELTDEELPGFGL